MPLKDSLKQKAKKNSKENFGTITNGVLNIPPEWLKWHDETWYYNVGDAAASVGRLFGNIFAKSSNVDKLDAKLRFDHFLAGRLVPVKGKEEIVQKAYERFLRKQAQNFLSDSDKEEESD